MKKETKMEYVYIMQCIKSESLRRKGSGFTVELYPDMIGSTMYVGATKPFTDKKYWKFSSINTAENTPDDHPLDAELKWGFHLTLALEIALRKDFEINRSLPTLIVDQRETREPRKGEKAYQITGRRVQLSVPDSYAIKVYLEEYADIGLPFRDTLLTKHRELLKELILDRQLYFQSYDKSELHCNAKLEVFRDRIYNTYRENCCCFERYGMQPLHSYGQVYGMALAVVEILREVYPEFLDTHTVDIAGGIEPYRGNMPNRDLDFESFQTVTASTPIAINFNHIGPTGKKLNEW